MADRLTQIASKPSIRNREESSDLDKSDDSSEDVSLPPIKGVRKESPLKDKENGKTKERFHLNQGTKVDFDELVERVKKRLSLDLKQKYRDNIQKEDIPSRNDKNNVKELKIDDYNNFIKKVASRITKLNKQNAKGKFDKAEMSAFDDESTNKKENVTSHKKQNAKNAEDQYNTEEMSPSADEATYEEQNVDKHTRNTINQFNNEKSSHLLDEATYEERNVAKQNKKIVTEQYNIEEMSPFADEPLNKEDIFNKPAVKQEIKTENEQYDYEDSFKELYPNGDKNLNPTVNGKARKIKLTTDDYSLYKKLDMTQKDSYEDYVTPAREVNIYASTEVKQRYNVGENTYNMPIHNRYKIENNRQHFHERYNKNNPTVKTKLQYNNHRETQLEKSIKPPNKHEYADKVIDSDEIKAKTENLWYDNEEKSNVDTIILSDALEKRIHGTRFPTRHTYKMATPNFVANLPVVVEKYNFNEPIPEADRERETLKYIGNPPASINKKVRLT